jgi:hypothetical protein
MPDQVDRARLAMGAAWVEVCDAWEKLQSSPRAWDTHLEPYVVWTGALATWISALHVFLALTTAAVEKEE